MSDGDDLNASERFIRASPEDTAYFAQRVEPLVEALESVSFEYYDGVRDRAVQRFVENHTDRLRSGMITAEESLYLDWTGPHEDYWRRRLDEDLEGQASGNPWQQGELEWKECVCEFISDGHVHLSDGRGIRCARPVLVPSSEWEALCERCLDTLRRVDPYGGRGYWSGGR